MTLLLLLRSRAAAPPPTGGVTLTYAGAGAAPSGTGLPATGNLTATPNLPTMTDGDLVLVAIGSKPDTAGVTVSDSAWNLVGPATGGSGVQGAGTGPVRETWYSRVKDASWSTMPDFTLDGTGNCLWAHAYVIRADVAATYDVAMASGARTVESTAWSVTCSTDPGFATGDMVLFGSATTASLTTTAEAISAPGVTFAAATEVAEPKTTRNNDVGGFTAETTVTAGASTGAPTVTATMSAAIGATGVSTVVRVRGVAVTTGTTTTVTSSQGTSWDVAAPVTSTRATTWAVRAATTSTRTTTWVTRTTLTAGRSSTWNTLGTVASTRVTAWETLRPVTDNRVTTWNTTATVTDNRVTTWNTTATVTGTRDTTWAVFAITVPGHATVISSTSGTTTAPLPPDAQTGDMVLVYTYSSTATAPTMPTGWSNVTSNAASPAFRCQRRVYDGVWTMPTFVNAVTVHAILIRGQSTTTPAASLASSNTSSATINWGADTASDLSGASVFIRTAVHTNPGVIIPTPAGYTKLQGDGTAPGYLTIAKIDSTILGATSASVLNSAAYSRNTVEVRAAPVLTSVTSSLGTSWDVTAPVSSVRSTAWETLAGATSTRSTSWAVRSTTGGSRDTLWAVRALATSTHATSWVVLASVASTRATSWVVLASVALTRPTTWTARAIVAGTRPTTWTARAIVAGTRPTTWTAGLRVTSTRDTSWNVAGNLLTINTSHSTTWAVRATTAGQRVTTWVTQTTITGQRVTTWAVRATITGQRVTTWTVRATVTGQRVTTWTVRATVVETQATTWTVRATVVETQATTWMVRARVTGQRSSTWAVLVLAVSTRDATWNVLAVIEGFRSTAWLVLRTGVSAPVVTPPERSARVAAETRLLTVAREDRQITAHADTRVLEYR